MQLIECWVTLFHEWGISSIVVYPGCYPKRSGRIADLVESAKSAPNILYEMDTTKSSERRRCMLTSSFHQDGLYKFLAVASKVVINILLLSLILLWIRVNWSGVATMVQVFSLLAVGTSQIGTLLGFSQFFLEQLNFLTSRSTSKRMKEVTHLQLVYPVNLELVYVILGFHILQKFFLPRHEKVIS